MMGELPYAIKERLRTSADLANVDESAVRPKIIVDTSRGDTATFDSYAIASASLLRQRKVVLKFRGPERDQRRDDRLERRPNRGAKGPGGQTIGKERPTQRAAGRVPHPGLEMSWLRARADALICCKGPCCPRVASIPRRFLQGARPTHERSETALCAARAPPRRPVGSRGRETRSCKSCAFGPNGVAGRRK